MTTSDSGALGESYRREFEKEVLLPLESSQVSHARAKYSVVWRLATFIPYVSLAQKPPIDLFKEKKFLLKS